MDYFTTSNHDAGMALKVMAESLKHSLKNSVCSYKTEQFQKYSKKEKCLNTYIKTILTFGDGSKEFVYCCKDDFDAYYGFVACYAKHAAKYYLNRNISDIANYWIIDKPKKDIEERAKVDAQRAEEQRLAECDKKRREKYRIRMETIRRKKVYEAVKLAEEKYGVPTD